jgi:hypothetical protein
VNLQMLLVTKPDMCVGELVGPAGTLFLIVMQ